MVQRYELQVDLKKMLCIYMYGEDQKDNLKTAADYNGLEDRAIYAFQNNPLFHAKVDAFTYRILALIENHYAALEKRCEELEQNNCALARTASEIKVVLDDVEKDNALLRKRVVVIAQECNGMARSIAREALKLKEGE